MTKHFLKLCMLFAITLLAVPPPIQAEAPHFYVPTVPANLGDVDFYLMTGGIGHEVNDRFGHTAIRVVNPTEGTDVVFNWGTFSFDDPDFLWRFYQGRLNYRMGARTFTRDLELYRHMGRLVSMDHLNLTDKQKKTLYERIAWNADPGRRVFAYQYWFKNCSTIPRDYLDEALHGAVKERFFDLAAHKVHRDYVRANLAYTPFVVPVLDILMNSNIDRPLTAWNDMFLPVNLRAWLATLPSFDDQGQPIPGSKLLGDAKTMIDNPEDFRPLIPDYAVLDLPLVGGLLVAWALFAMAHFGAEDLAARRRQRGYRALGVATTYWGLFAGLFGTLLLLNWFFSGHPDGWHNANLWLFWPVDWAFLGFGLAMARQGKPVRRQAGPWFCVAHALGFLTLCVLSATHVVVQNIWWVVDWFGLPGLLLFGTLWACAFSVPMALPAPEPVLGKKDRDARLTRRRPIGSPR